MASIKNDRNVALLGGDRLLPINIAVSTAVKDYGINIIAINVSNTLLVGYEYRLGTSWEGSDLLASTNSSSYLWNAQTAGIYTIWCAAIDIYGNYSVPAYSVATIAAPGYSAISGVIDGPNLKLTWTISAALSTFAIDSYEVRFGSEWSNAEFLDNTKSTYYYTRVGYFGARKWWVAAKDIAGNYSEPTGVDVIIVIPDRVSGIYADVLDNNVLLYWTAPSIGTGQLPIDQYEVRKGLTWEEGALIGSNANSTFTSIFEQSSGSYTYWVSAIDTAGTYGEVSNLTTNVSQPPDFVLRNNYNSNMLGTSENFYVENGRLIGPVDTTQIWTGHFSDNLWNSPQDQVNAGYPVYNTPGLTTGSYEEVLDYGTSVPSTIAAVTVTTSAIVGIVTAVCTISWKLNLADPWTVLTPGTTVVLLPLFRYLRVHFDFVGESDASILRINNLNIKLAIKQRTDSGNSVALIGGTDVLFGYPFISADTPIVQPASTTTPLVPLVVYVGSTNPTGFSVKIFNLSGVEVGGAFSWTVRGY